ncbi:2-oxo-4-hydroxy-4-carboxy-5-ureidoimidazoline decarboxylase [Aldersonia kunmingensis]|uniref:2-oxo-4-hydroxy-4-carboxy-5-ureidoimidazoline decarboxylase n=1 Tax=Aldersonia kunmingensis TaxID=408066 RepID=UPI000829593F|nr:2-oxo-4-hydroxy-4-carboxy-5-ureidoimidazoline decarboxylase [Aldersonia kunmingensis]
MPQQAIDDFNGLTDIQAAHALFGICASPAWARQVAAGRPYADAAALFDNADRVLAQLPESEIDAALDGHPRIGARVAANSRSAGEQAAVQSAADELLDELAAGNRAYEDRFGHVYLVFASGRSARDLLDTLIVRLANDPATERSEMRSELAKINRLRLERLLAAGRES